MKTLLVLLLAVVGVTFAAECDTLTRLKIKSQWRRAYSHGHDREDFAQAIARAVFAQVPTARKLFDNFHGDDTTSPEFEAVALRILSKIDSLVNLLDYPDALKAEIDQVYYMVKDSHIQSKYYTALRTALLHVLPAQLGRCWDKDAWKACFDYVTDKIEHHTDDHSTDHPTDPSPDHH